MKIIYNHKYEAGHTYSETWETCGWFCPFCGMQDVWIENSGGGDYYHGENAICTSCKTVFAEPIQWDSSDTEQLLNAINNATMDIQKNKDLEKARENILNEMETCKKCGVQYSAFDSCPICSGAVCLVQPEQVPIITLRDHFAGMVLGAIGTGSFDNLAHKRAYAKMEAEYAYIVADAMLEAREGGSMFCDHADKYPPEQLHKMPDTGFIMCPRCAAPCRMCDVAFLKEDLDADGFCKGCVPE